MKQLSDGEEMFGSRFVQLQRRRHDGRIRFSFWEHSEETAASRTKETTEMTTESYDEFVLGLLFSIIRSRLLSD